MGWKWYARALSSKGNVGTQDSAGSKIYLNAQTWAVLAGVADGDRLSQVLEAVDSMEQDFGFPLNLPPYPEYDAHVGRMSGMLPGLFENGGVYCHATGFKILMDCCTGRGEKALKTLKRLCLTAKRTRRRSPGQNLMYLPTAIPRTRDITENPISHGQQELPHGA